MAAKESVNRSFESGLSDGVMFERRLFHSLFATADQKEGMDAFLNKRPPAFTQRRKNAGFFARILAFGGIAQSVRAQHS